MKIITEPIIPTVDFVPVTYRAIIRRNNMLEVTFGRNRAEAFRNMLVRLYPNEIVR